MLHARSVTRTFGGANRTFGNVETKMRTMNFVRAALVATFLMTLFGIPCERALLSTRNDAPADRDTVLREEFLAMIKAVDAAQLELQNGRPAAFKALWSRADDITLSGGFGGKIEKGWDQVSRRLDWVGTQFSKGSHTTELIASTMSGQLGYLVQIEHLRFHVSGQAKESTRDYRVTMIFRREDKGWRIIHRQADSQVVMQAPK
jgi:ketosteroid isomerase-like protein